MLFFTYNDDIIFLVIIMVTTTPINSHIGKRIKEYREAKGYTQEYMSKVLDIAPNHYGRIERGENSCTMSKLITICNLLEITPNDLIGEFIINDENQIFADYLRLSLEDQATVSKFIKFLLKG